jgi:Terminase small subunit
VKNVAITTAKEEAKEVDKEVDISDLIEPVLQNVGACEQVPTLPAMPCVRDSHEVFAHAFARHGNKLAAYREAYPTCQRSTAAHQAYVLATNPDVLRRVHELTAARREQLLRDTEDLEALVANLCIGNAANLFDEEGRPVPVHLLPTDVKAAIESLKLKVVRTRRANVEYDEDGNETDAGDLVTEHEYEVKFPSPLQAAKLLAQLRGKLIERKDVTSDGKALNALDPADVPSVEEELRRQLLGDSVEDLV